MKRPFQSVLPVVISSAFSAIFFILNFVFLSFEFVSNLSRFGFRTFPSLNTVVTANSDAQRLRRQIEKLRTAANEVQRI
jgi:hypothetical protein